MPQPPVVPRAAAPQEAELKASSSLKAMMSSLDAPSKKASSSPPRVELQSRAVTLIDVASRSLGVLASKIRAKEVGQKRDLRSYMALSEVGGSQRLFRFLASKEPNLVLERLLRGSPSSKEVMAPLPPEDANIEVGRDLRENADLIQEWMFDEASDPVRRVCLEAPTFVDANDEPSALAQNDAASEWYASTTSKRDVALDVVKARLADAVDLHQTCILEGAEHVAELREHVAQAAVRATNAKRKLREGRDDVVVDFLHLLQLRRRKQRAEALLALALKTKDALDTLNRAYGCLLVSPPDPLKKKKKTKKQTPRGGDFRMAAASAAEAKKLLFAAPLDGIAALDEPRERADDALPAIRFAADAALWKALFFDDEQDDDDDDDDDDAKKKKGEDSLDRALDDVLGAYEAVDQHLEHDDDDDFYHGREDRAERLEDAALANVLRVVAKDDDDDDPQEEEPSGSSSELFCDSGVPPKRLWRSGPGHVEANAGGLGERVAAYCCASLATFGGRALSLPCDAIEELVKARRCLSSKQVASLLADRDDRAKVETPAFAKTMLAISRRVVSALDVADRARRWHRRAFPDLEKDEKGLFRDDGDGEEEGEPSSESSPSPPSQPSSSRKAREAQVLKRVSTREALETAPEVAWKVGRALVTEGLKCGGQSDRPPRVEDVVCAVVAVNVTRCLAKKLASPRRDDLESDRESLRAFGRAYLRSTRANASSVLVQMLDCEPWCAISSQVDDDLLLVGGENDRDRARASELAVARAVVTHGADRFADLASLCDLVARRVRTDDDESRHAVQDLVREKRLVDDDDDQDDDGVVSASTPHSSCRDSSGSAFRSFLDALPDFEAFEPRARAALAALGRVDEAPAAAVDTSSSSSSYVATQAAYHGLCKAATKLAQIALLVDGAEDEVVDALVELFDAYATHVALKFVPAATLRGFSPREATKSANNGENNAAAGTSDDVLACDVCANAAFVSFASRVGLFEEVESSSSKNGRSASSSGSSEPKASSFFLERNKNNNEAAAAHDAGEEDQAEEEKSPVTEDEIRTVLVAGHSLTFAARVLRAAASAALDRAAPERQSAARARVEGACDAADELRGLVFRSLGPRLAGAAAVVRAIRDVKGAWAAETIQEESNDYVDVAAKRFEDLWTMLGSLDDRGTDHDEDKEILWREAVQAVFEAVVDGFANVDHCSTEGRALMSMDLQVLQFSLDKIHRARPTRGADYAGLYIKAFYFAENDLLDWIADNRPHYKERHMVNLLQARLGKANKKKTYLKDLLSFSTSSSSSSSSR